MNNKYSIYLLVIALIVSLGFTISTYSEAQSLRREIENNKRTSAMMSIDEIISVNQFTSQWNNKQDRDKREIDYVLYFEIISDRLNNAYMLLLAGPNETSEKSDLMRLLRAYQTETSMYAKIFHSGRIEEKDIINADALFNDLHLITKWMMDNRKDSHQLVSIEELQEDGLLDKLTAQMVYSWRLP